MDKKKFLNRHSSKQLTQQILEKKQVNAIEATTQLMAKIMKDHPNPKGIFCIGVFTVLLDENETLTASHKEYWLIKDKKKINVITEAIRDTFKNYSGPLI